jgi:NAD(P)-dependent dehydrogenase (short-subunit alcohol dehydrogenase family)
MSLSGLDKANAVVTGASSGIGLAITKKLVQEGVSVAAISRDKVRLTRALREGGVPDRPPWAAFEADLSDPLQCTKVAEKILEDFRSIQFLILCAGVNHRASLANLSRDAWDRVMNTNLTGPAFLISAFAQHLCEDAGDRGRIVAIGSISANGYSDHVAYSASKAGLRGVIATAALEFGESGVTCYTIEPGWIETPMTANTPAERREKIKSRTALKRLGSVSDIPGLVALLCSTEGGYITGEVIRVAGGLKN